MLLHHERMSIRIPIFTPGEHTAMNGATRVYTQDDISATAAFYNPALFQAPVVLGHPEHNHPAWGWVTALAFEDGQLVADLDDLDPDFIDWVRSGRYKKISASFYLPDSPANPVPGVLYLRHIGFLGAAAPSLKNLPTVALPMDLAEADGVHVFISENLKQSEQTYDQETPMTQEHASNPDDLQVQIDALKAENNTLKTQNASFQEQAQAAQAALIDQQRQAMHAGHAAFCETLIGEGRMLPAHKAVAVALMDLIASQETPVQFGEGDEQAPLTVEAFKATLKSTPVLVPFGEASQDKGNNSPVSSTLKVPAGYEVDQKSAELHRNALAYQEAHVGCDYLTAVTAVSQQ